VCPAKNLILTGNYQKIKGAGSIEPSLMGSLANIKPIEYEKYQWIPGRSIANSR
jgi:hypothetical protein